MVPEKEETNEGRMNHLFSPESILHVFSPSIYLFTNFDKILPKSKHASQRKRCKIVEKNKRYHKRESNRIYAFMHMYTNLAA